MGTSRGTNDILEQIRGSNPMPKVKFSKENQEVTVPEGTTIREAAKLLNIKGIKGVNLLAACAKCLAGRGLSSHGACRVIVTEGHGENTNGLTLWEKMCFLAPFPNPVMGLSYLDNPEQTRLACECKVTGDVTVDTNPDLNLFGENFFS